MRAAEQIFGSSHSGKCQKRYRHKKNWNIIKDGECQSMLITDVKSKEEEIRQVKEFLKMSKSEKAILRWTATEHYDCEKVEITL